MKISKLMVNRLTSPLGFDLTSPSLSYVVSGTEAKTQKSARILVSADEDFSEVVYDSGVREDIDRLDFELPIELMPSTRYFWKVQVWGDNGEEGESETAWFETAKDDSWVGKWISPKADKQIQASVYRDFTVDKPVKKARMYGVGLGIYELYLNGEKQGDEYLLPGLHSYDAWMQYQTFELDVKEGTNRIEFMLGDGWYKGKFGLSKKQENYGDRLACIGDLVIWFEDGTTMTVGTDTQWKARRNKVESSGIYPGEHYNAMMDVSEVFETEEISPLVGPLTPRLSPRIVVNNRLKPVELIHTPAGETVLDMGQNMVGWITFTNNQPKGTKLLFQFGEILQDGNFYNDNLRKAEAEFSYISNGEPEEVRPHFTFYGFRYVKINGWTGEVNKDDFTGLVIHSEMTELGNIETGDPLVNRLFLNAKWGQKGNFLDVPTDCPQRDERMGWTGDAQIFSGTACYNMDTYAFYTKYGRDVYSEQLKLNGSVPDVVPLVNFEGDGSTAWGEAATVIPWNVYLHYGKKGILRRQYASMKAWVDYMNEQDDKYGSKRLWQSGFHYADWLALDGRVEGGVYGATDPFLVSSAYYYYSTDIVAKAAKVLGNEEDAVKYQTLAEEIKAAFQEEYFTKTGRLSVDTMTAYVMSLFMGLTPEGAYERTCKGLLNKLKENNYHLCTGFVGTPYLCRALSDNGMNDLAYHLLMEKGFPGWLYEVIMGATTVWERWNSVLPNGKISGTEMNSLNHYAYGSIVEWMYRDMIGICPAEGEPGFRRAVIAPKPNYVIGWAKCTLDTASGTYKVSWELKDKKLKFCVTVPFDTQAKLVLPDADAGSVEVKAAEGCNVAAKVQAGKNVEIELVPGEYEFIYEPTAPYRKIYSIYSPVEDLMENEAARKIVQEDFFDVYGRIPFVKETPVLLDLANGPFTQMPYEKQAEIDAKLRQAE